MEKIKGGEYIHVEEEEIDIFEIINSLKKRIKIIIAVTIIPTIITGLVTLLMTDIYRAETTILPISERRGISIEGLQNVFPIPFGGSEDSKKIIAILKSRYIKEKIVDKLNLISVLVPPDLPEEDKKETAIKILGSMTNINEDRKLGTITLSVDHEDKMLAKRIVEAYLEELQNIIDEKALTKAKVERLSVEKKLKDLEERIKRLQNELIEFQKKTNLIAPEKQLTSSIEAYSALINEKINIEMELKSLLTKGENIEKITELRNRLREINNKIKEFESKNSQNILLSFKEVPEEITHYYSLIREIRLSQNIYETLLKLYENIRFAEMKEAIYVEVIDPPYVFNEPVKPKRKLIIGIAFIASLFLGITLALIIESFVKRQKSSLPFQEDGHSKQ